MWPNRLHMNFGVVSSFPHVQCYGVQSWLICTVCLLFYALNLISLWSVRKNVLVSLWCGAAIVSVCYNRLFPWSYLGVLPSPIGPIASLNRYTRPSFCILAAETTLFIFSTFDFMAWGATLVFTGLVAVLF